MDESLINESRGPHELASEIELHKIFVIGYTLTLAPLLDPSMPLLDYYAQRLGQSHISPAMISRKDGSIYSQEPMKAWLSRAAANGSHGGLGLGGDLLIIAMFAVMNRIGDEMHRDRLDLYDKDVPITQFVRHLRNACAHGNRWSFIKTKKGQEPLHLARCRNITLTPDLHGRRALMDDGLLGPGDFLDVLDELVKHLRSLPNTTGHQAKPLQDLPPPPPPHPSEPYVDASDVEGMRSWFDAEEPDWRTRYSADLASVDATTLRHLIAGVRVYLMKVIAITEEGGLSTGQLTADQAVHSFAKNALEHLQKLPDAKST